MLTEPELSRNYISSVAAANPFYLAKASWFSRPNGDQLYSAELVRRGIVSVSFVLLSARQYFLRASTP